MVCGIIRYSRFISDTKLIFQFLFHRSFIWKTKTRPIIFRFKWNKRLSYLFILEWGFSSQGVYVILQKITSTFCQLELATAFKKQDRKKFSTIGLDAFIKFAIASSNFNGLTFYIIFHLLTFFYLINLRFMLHSRIIKIEYHTINRICIY